MVNLQFSFDDLLLINEALKHKINSIKEELIELDEWEPVTQYGREQDKYEREKLKRQLNEYEELYKRV